ncbi:MAG TPA: serine/threonine protein kinase, partial [Planctomycetes bacterium]|nr:serine/threonine protein kinase [Planctomycetota bacterium]
MGVVYRALDPRSGRHVALKLLHDTSERFRSRFQREAELLARLRHPHVVGVHGAGEVAGKPYLVMELIEGESLSERIRRRGRLSDQEAARFTAQVARGAGHAHAAGLVHRDIKPANVLLSSEGEGERALLTDFGLARDLAVESDLSKTGVFLGTPGYAAPEQAAGQRDRISPASDVYG